MRIQIDAPNGTKIEFNVHSTGGATVRVDERVVGAARWEKDGNTMRFYSMPMDTFRHEDDDEKLVFGFDTKP